MSLCVPQWSWRIISHDRGHFSPRIIVPRWFTLAGAPKYATKVFAGLLDLQFSLACLLVPYLKRFEHLRMHGNAGECRRI